MSRRSHLSSHDYDGDVAYKTERDCIKRLVSEDACQRDKLSPHESLRWIDLSERRVVQASQQFGGSLGHCWQADAKGKYFTPNRRKSSQTGNLDACRVHRTREGSHEANDALLS